MKKCDIVTYPTPVGPPYYANGPYRTVCRCTTHGLGDWGPMSTDDNELCPIGKIERATEDALAKIASANEAIARRIAALKARAAKRDLAK